MQCCSVLHFKSLEIVESKGKVEGEREGFTLTFNRFISKCGRLHVAACFSGSCESGSIQRHAAKRGDVKLTDLISSKMLNHKVMRRWQPPASHSSQIAALISSKLACLPCSIQMWKATSVVVGSFLLTLPRNSLDHRVVPVIPTGAGILQSHILHKQFGIFWQCHTTKI